MALIHWWPLNGDLHDQGSSPVTLVNSGATVDNNGKTGKCYSFNGSSTYMYANNTCGTNVTVACWAKTSTDYRMLWGMQCASSNYMNLYYNDSTYCLNTGDSTANPFVKDSGGKVTRYIDGQWHHLTVVFKGSETAKLYIDGDYVGHATTYRNPTMNNQEFTIGYWNHVQGGTYIYNGQICDMRVYNEALSADAIHEISQACILHYPLNNNGRGIELPSEYQRVEYLESTGTQYIDTGYTATTNTKLELDTLFISKDTNSQYGGIYGCSRASGAWGGFGRLQNYYEWGTQDVGSGSYNLVNNTRYLFVQDGGKFYQNGTLVWTGIDSTTTCWGTFLISGMRFSSTIDRSLLKIYNVKLYTNNRLAFHGIPCYRKSDGKPGLYDTVSNTFKVNAGSGEFLLGPSIGVPIEYQQVEYLQGTGEQWIDSGYKATDTTTHNFMYSIEEYTLDKKFYGSYGESGKGICIGVIGSQWRLGSNTWTGSYGSATSNPTHFYIKNGAVNINGTVLTTISSIGNTVNTLPIGGIKYQNNIFEIIKGKYYFVRFFDTEVKKDFIPCYHKLTGKPGMYDIINNIFYTNSGSGEFLLGPSVGLPERYRQCEYLGSTGTQVIDTGYDLKSTNFIFEDIYEYAALTSGEACIGGTASIWEFGNTGSNFFNYLSSNTTFAYGPGTPAINTKYHYKAIATASNYNCSINNSLGTAVSYAADSVGKRLYINRYYGTGHNLNGKQYMVRLWEDSHISMDLLPAYDTITKVYGMYDICSGKFLTNSGSGTFTAGTFTGFTMDSVKVGDSTTVYDISGFGNNGICPSQNSYSENTVRYDNCMYIPNGRDYPIICDAFQWPKDVITMNCWFRTSNTAPHNEYHMPIESKNASAYEMSVYKNGALRAGCLVGGTRYIDNTGTTLCNGEWHMLTLVYNGSKILRYIDGIDTGLYHNVTGALQGSTGLYIGTYGTTGTYGTREGFESDVCIYATALSANDIAKLYSQRNDGGAVVG